MRRQLSQLRQANKSLTQLLALNALFDAARTGDAGRELAAAVQIAAQVASRDESADAGCDALLTHFYAALMEGSPRPPRLS